MVPPIRIWIREICAVAVVMIGMAGIEIGRAHDAGAHAELFSVVSIAIVIFAFVMARCPVVQPPSCDLPKKAGSAPSADKLRVRVLQGNWIRWSGDDDCPVSPNTVVETLHGNGAAFTGRYARYAKEWQRGWQHGESIALDIIFFRIVR